APIVGQLVPTGSSGAWAFPDPTSAPTNPYGPIAQWVFHLCVSSAGLSPVVAVWMLQLLALISFLAVGLLLDAFVRRCDGSATSNARSRVAVMWMLNPIILLEVVNGAHIDSLAIVMAVAALLLASRSAIGAGLLIGVAVAIKVSYGLYTLSIVWALRQ